MENKPVSYVKYYYLKVGDVLLKGHLTEQEARGDWRIMYANGMVTDTTPAWIYSGENEETATFYSPVN